MIDMFGMNEEAITSLQPSEQSWRRVEVSDVCHFDLCDARFKQQERVSHSIVS